MWYVSTCALSGPPSCAGRWVCPILLRPAAGTAMSRLRGVCGAPPFVGLLCIHVMSHCSIGCVYHAVCWRTMPRPRWMRAWTVAIQSLLAESLIVGAGEARGRRRRGKTSGRTDPFLLAFGPLPPPLSRVHGTPHRFLLLRSGLRRGQRPPPPPGGGFRKVVRRGALPLSSTNAHRAASGGDPPPLRGW